MPKIFYKAEMSSLLSKTCIFLLATFLKHD